MEKFFDFVRNNKIDELKKFLDEEKKFYINCLNSDGVKIFFFFIFNYFFINFFSGLLFICHHIEDIMILQKHSLIMVVMLIQKL
jgi:hypothetical protein